MYISGQRGLYTTSSGLQIAYLSGAYDKSNFSSAASSGVGKSDSEAKMVCKLAIIPKAPKGALNK